MSLCLNWGIGIRLGVVVVGRYVLFFFVVDGFVVGGGSVSFIFGFFIGVGKLIMEVGIVGLWVEIKENFRVGSSNSFLCGFRVLVVGSSGIDIGYGFVMIGF